MALARKKAFLVEIIAELRQPPAFMRAVERAHHTPAAEIIARLLDAVMTFANGTQQEDDLTALVVRRL